MAQLDEVNFMIIDENKARAKAQAKKDQEKMKKEIKEFLDDCNVQDLQKLSQIVKQSRKDEK